MDEQPRRNSLKVSGKYYVTDDCLGCQACEEAAPNHFRYGDKGVSYVFKQPENPEEELKCRNALEACPMEAIRDDGTLLTNGS